MKKGDIKIIWVVLAIFVSLGLFWGLHTIYINYLTEKPVVDKLENMSFINNVKIEKDESLYIFKVEINKAGNIRNEYKEVEKVIKSKYKENEYKIEFIDKRHQALQKINDELQPSIYEALAKNNYLWLNEQVKNAAEKHGYIYRVFMDEKRIYIQLQDAEYFLYQTIERPSLDLKNNR